MNDQEKAFWIQVFMAAYETEKATVEIAAADADKAIKAFRKSVLENTGK